MRGVHIPVVSSALDERGLIEVAHDYLGLIGTGLEPGELLILQTMDGQHRTAEVLSLSFTTTRTIYRLTYGAPIAEVIADALVESWGRPVWFTDETVLDLLGSCVPRTMAAGGSA